MEAWTVFHSDEADDPSLLAEGWYIAPVERLTTDDAVGPFTYEQAAHEAIAREMVS